MFSIALAPSLRRRMHSCAFICCGIVARVRVGDVGCRASSGATVLSTPRLQLCPSAAGVLATTCSGLLVTGATLNLQVPEPAVQQVPVLHFLFLRDTADADVTQGTVRLKAFVHGGGAADRGCPPWSFANGPRKCIVACTTRLGHTTFCCRTNTGVTHSPLSPRCRTFLLLPAPPPPPPPTVTRHSHASIATEAPSDGAHSALGL
jgi:hypothetical protein